MKSVRAGVNCKCFDLIFIILSEFRKLLILIVCQERSFLLYLGIQWTIWTCSLINSCNGSAETKYNVIHSLFFMFSFDFSSMERRWRYIYFWSVWRKWIHNKNKNINKLKQRKNSNHGMFHIKMRYCVCDLSKLRSHS